MAHESERLDRQTGEMESKAANASRDTNRHEIARVPVRRIQSSEGDPATTPE